METFKRSKSISLDSKYVSVTLNGRAWSSGMFVSVNMLPHIVVKCMIHNVKCELSANSEYNIYPIVRESSSLINCILTTHSDPAAGLWGVVGSVAITETSLYHWTNWVTFIHHALSFVSHSIHWSCILFGTCSLINQMAKVNKRLLNKRILSASQLFTVLNLTMQF